MSRTFVQRVFSFATIVFFWINCSLRAGEDNLAQVSTIADFFYKYTMKNKELSRMEFPFFDKESIFTNKEQLFDYYKKNGNTISELDFTFKSIKESNIGDLSKEQREILDKHGKISVYQVTFLAKEKFGIKKKIDVSIDFYLHEENGIYTVVGWLEHF